MKKSILCVLAISAFLLLGRALAFADVIVKIAVVNPSASEKTVPVRYPLPSGLSRQDILDTGKLKVDYDIDESRYYVSGNLALGPKESKTLKITIRDIWRIPDSEIKDLVNILKDKAASIKDEKKHEAAKIIAADLNGELESIMKHQESLAGDIEKRMQAYSVDAEKLKTIKDEIFSLENIIEFGKETASSESTVSLVIEAKNILDQNVVTPITYYLPKEIIPEYIVDKGGLDLKYDSAKAQFYLTAKESFKPGEKKRFNIVVRNVWKIADKLLKRYLEESSKINDVLQNTELSALGTALFNEIKRNTDEIKETQGKAEAVKEYISAYRVNENKLALIKDDLDKLRELADKVSKSQSVQRRKVKLTNVLKQVEYLSSLRKASNAVFKKLRQIAIWKVIMTIVIFIIGLTIFFYTVWFINLKKEEKRKLENVTLEEEVK